MRKHRTIKRQLTAIRDVASQHPSEYTQLLISEIDMKLSEIEATEICYKLDKDSLDVLEVEGIDYEAN